MSVCPLAQFRFSPLKILLKLWLCSRTFLDKPNNDICKEKVQSVYLNLAMHFAFTIFIRSFHHPPGAGARVGDSGGGLIFKDEKDGFFYLRGVVSTREPGESSIATFTDIALYISWIRKVVSTVDRSAINDDTLVNVKTQL